ncbi:hypothetical protein [Deferrisoma sp.]|nr:MAG: hypothetical protein D6708_02815 [Candidatus Dadabacteria bacterium]
MEIVRGRLYRVVVEYPWGKRVEVVTREVVRETDGTVRWAGEDGGGALDVVIGETEARLLGWHEGHTDVTVRIEPAE